MKHEQLYLCTWRQKRECGNKRMARRYDDVCGKGSSIETEKNGWLGAARNFIKVNQYRGYNLHKRFALPKVSRSKNQAPIAEV
jgi:hypothetical protein